MKYRLLIALPVVLLADTTFAQDVRQSLDGALTALNSCLDLRKEEGKARSMTGEEFYKFIIPACPDESKAVHDKFVQRGKELHPQFTDEQHSTAADFGVRIAHLRVLYEYEGKIPNRPVNPQPKNDPLTDRSK
jgi:hypothetical protein